MTEEGNNVIVRKHVPLCKECVIKGPKIAIDVWKGERLD